jgi:hypothetical protein
LQPEGIHEAMLLVLVLVLAMVMMLVETIQCTNMPRVEHPWCWRRLHSTMEPTQRAQTVMLLIAQAMASKWQQPEMQHRTL